MLDSKRGLLPVRHGIHLSKIMSPKTSEEMVEMAKVPYAYAVIVTSRFQSNPGLEH